MSLEELLDEGRKALEVGLDELAEARRWRSLVEEALRAEFPGSRVYYTGSVAHGDANTPLKDVDLGIVIAGAHEYGPDGLGPEALMERARDSIKEHLKDEFRKLIVAVKGRHRSVLVRFGKPIIDSGENLTADVIVAIDHPSGRGIYIPDLDSTDKWEHVDPEAHTRMILQAIEDTDKVFARAVRLLKHWRDRHGSPMCSWNIKALALECLDESMSLVDALDAFFSHAASEIADHLTEDPAGVAEEPIRLNMAQDEAAGRLAAARDKVKEAREHEQAGRPASAQHDLHWLLPGIVPDSALAHQMEEEARRNRAGIPLSRTGSLPSTRAWALY
jgi:predicted nucleotidyltransferase